MENKNLKLPANCAALNEEEMTYTQGGGMVAEVFYAFGKMFQHAVYSTWDSESKKLEEAHGAVVSQQGNVYTYSDGFTCTREHGTSLSFVIGDIFYGIGDLFNAFGL